MTSPDDYSTPTDTQTSAAGAPSLSRLLETWQAWSGSEMFARAEARARAAGDDEQAARLRDLTARDREVAALDALTAQHEISALLSGWEWHAVRAARDQGATWADIARATRTDPEQARTAYLDQVGRQEQAAERGWLPFDDAPKYRAAAGMWFDELHPDTPDHVVEQIEAAIIRDDVDELAALRSAWWNPAHVPPVTASEVSEVSEAATETARDDGKSNPWAAVAGADQVSHTHTAAANRGLGDSAFAAVTVDAGEVFVDNGQPAQGEADEAVAWPVMPEWMHEQARRTEAEIAAGTYAPGPVDDPARLAARLAELREQAAAGDAGGSTVRECNRPSRAAPSCLVDTDDEQDARREQLARWHADDTDTAAATDGAGDQDGDGAAVGPGTHCILVTGDEQR